MLDLPSPCHRLLLFGGSFDPPHRAHAELPEAARRSLGFDAIAYIPAAISPFKREAPPAPAEHRLEMLRLLLTDHPHAVICTDELDRAADDAEPSYTADTVRRLHAQLGETVTLRLLIGTDQMASFHRWREADAIAALAEPAVMLRPPDTINSALAALPPGSDREAWRRRIVELPTINVSSTAIRDGDHGGLPPTVARYIDAHGLYAD